MSRLVSFLVGTREAALMRLFTFHAARVWYDETSLCLAFADKAADHDHYFSVQRSEKSPEESVPDVGNVYIELDDQCWGGYGGIERLSLERAAFTVVVTPRMVPYMRGHDGVRVTFDLPEQDFKAVRRVLQKLLRGYEQLLQLPADPAAAAGRPREGR